MGNENKEGDDQKGKDVKLKGEDQCLLLIIAPVQGDTFHVDPCEMPLPHAGFGFPHLFKAYQCVA